MHMTYIEIHECPVGKLRWNRAIVQLWLHVLQSCNVSRGLQISDKGEQTWTVLRICETVLLLCLCTSHRCNWCPRTQRTDRALLGWWMDRYHCKNEKKKINNQHELTLRILKTEQITWQSHHKGQIDLMKVFNEPPNYQAVTFVWACPKKDRETVPPWWPILHTPNTWWCVRLWIQRSLPSVTTASGGWVRTVCPSPQRVTCSVSGYLPSVGPGTDKGTPGHP